MSLSLSLPSNPLKSNLLVCLLKGTNRQRVKDVWGALLRVFHSHPVVAGFDLARLRSCTPSRFPSLQSPPADCVRHTVISGTHRGLPTNNDFSLIRRLQTGSRQPCVLSHAHPAFVPQRVGSPGTSGKYPLSTTAQHCEVLKGRRK